MAKDIERGKHISVLVEQAFPTCILVSYEDEGKTFRGVLLHESSHTVTRASVSKAIDNNDGSSSLCLTAARTVTCESNEPPAPSSRVRTRSSTMSHDQDNTPNNGITPVHKIRGLVKKLSPRKRQASATEDTTNPTEPEPQTEKSPQQKITLMKSLKRKRTNSSPAISPKLEKLKSKEEAGVSVASKLSLSPNLSPLYPVLKLRRTAGTRNNYVAVSTVSENSNPSQLSDIRSSDENVGSTLEDNTHKHNTRFKSQKQTGQDPDELESRKNPSVQSQDDMSVLNGESLVEVYTTSSMLDEKPKNNRVNTDYAKRGVQPRNHNQEMRVGDIVWGKVHGHPWWPGRILGILCNASESDAGFVKVAWYGSTTTSEISCSFLLTFQENFKQLFKKQKTGAYRRAVREAQQDLQVMSEDGLVLTT